MHNVATHAEFVEKIFAEWCHVAVQPPPNIGNLKLDLVKHRVQFNKALVQFEHLLQDTQI